MAKLIHILAASVGGGLVLGAGIRLGEAIGSSRAGHGHRPGSADGERGRKSGSDSGGGHAWVNGRLNRLEERLSQVSLLQEEFPQAETALHATPLQAPANGACAAQWQDILAGVISRIDRQQEDMEAIRQRVSSATRALDSVGEMEGHLRNDLHRQLREDLDHRLAAVENKFRLSMETAHQETVDAMVESIETRVVPRISRLENDVASQSAAMTELRDCSLQSERSIQRLLGVLERVVNPNAGPAETAPEKGPAPDPASPADLHKLRVVIGRQG